MKKILTLVLALALSITALSGCGGELGEYYRSVFSLLNTGFQKQPYHSR